jgi:hypothetical protein
MIAVNTDFHVWAACLPLTACRCLPKSCDHRNDHKWTFLPTACMI